MSRSLNFSVQQFISSSRAVFGRLLSAMAMAMAPAVDVREHASEEERWIWTGALSWSPSKSGITLFDREHDFKALANAVADPSTRKTTSSDRSAVSSVSSRPAATGEDAPNKKMKKPAKKKKGISEELAWHRRGSMAKAVTADVQNVEKKTGHRNKQRRLSTLCSKFHSDGSLKGQTPRGDQRPSRLQTKGAAAGHIHRGAPMWPHPGNSNGGFGGRGAAGRGGVRGSSAANKRLQAATKEARRAAAVRLQRRQRAHHFRRCVAVQRLPRAYRVHLARRLVRSIMTMRDARLENERLRRVSGI